MLVWRAWVAIATSCVVVVGENVGSSWRQNVGLSEGPKGEAKAHSSFGKQMSPVFESSTM